MLFNSYEFIFLFLPLVLIVFYFLDRRVEKRAQLVWLIISSLFFYGWWNVTYLWLIVLSMLVNFMAGLMLSGNRQKINRKLVLIAGIGFNLAALGYYKYANFFIDNINSAFDIGWNVGNILLPLAISFFTFQQITYLVDTYYRKTSDCDFIQYALFVTFFPQLIAGPIVHHSEMMPQFYRQRSKDEIYRNISIGFSVFFIGLFKKVVIADSLSPYAIEIFSAVSSDQQLTFYEAWFGAMVYTFQLYFDFSGYSDMAIGIAFLFGISLPQNFNSPYKAASIIDFWRRWHITLSRFLRDYVYIPLGGNRKGEFRRYTNLITTMFIGGVWHGAGWTFIVWGMLHGCMLALNHIWQQLKHYAGIGSSRNGSVVFLSRLLTFTCVSLAWVYFRSDNMMAANSMLSAMLGNNGIFWPDAARSQMDVFVYLLPEGAIKFAYLAYFNGMEHIVLIIFLLLFTWYAPNTQQIFAEYDVTTNRVSRSRVSWKPATGWLLFISLIAVISILKLGEVSEFLYFQF